jgi:hypothetical protein
MISAEHLSLARSKFDSHDTQQKKQPKIKLWTVSTLKQTNGTRCSCFSRFFDMDLYSLVHARYVNVVSRKFNIF